MILTVIGILLGIVSLVFILQNMETVTYTFIAWSVTAPRSLVFFIIFSAGLLLGLAISLLRRRRKSRK
jgi:uncharacterized integral membrane protein